MFLKILKWIGIVVLSLVALLALIVSFRQNLKYESPYPKIVASKDSAVIARGKEIVFGPAHCADCHHVGNADSLLKLGQTPALTGRFKFELPLGNYYTPNLTPDPTTGIGRFTDGEVARVLRNGVRPDGTAAFNFMPFHDMSEKHQNHDGRVINAFFIKPVGPTKPVIQTIKRDTSDVYGAYLAYSVANCNGCHTNRDMMTGDEIGQPFAGGLVFEEPGIPALTVPNITPSADSRIAGWSQDDFIKRFRMGKTIPYSHMPWSSFARMSDDDLKAVYNFLQTIKPAKTGALLAKK